MDHEHYRHVHSHSGSSMKKAAFKVALKDKKQIAEGTYAFIFEKPEEFKFKAGQHVRMTLANSPETDGEGDSRFLTLASTPQDTDLVFAMRMRDTAFKRVLGRMRNGEKVLIEILLDVPHGAFALHDSSSIPAVFIVGGIGIVPAYSMIKDWAERKLSHKIFLFYSNRRPEDATYLKELEDLAKQNRSFTFVPTMTEPEKSKREWQGETGFISQSMLKKYVDNPQTPMYYIAGMAEMVDAMKIVVKGLGVNDENIKAEEFSGFKMGDHNTRVTHSVWKKHALLIAAAVAAIVFVIVHIMVATSISDAGLFSLKNPILYILIGPMLVLATFKFKHLRGFIKQVNK